MTVRCNGCGYDLTGLPGFSRCPECGRLDPIAMRDWASSPGSRRVASYCLLAGMTLLIAKVAVAVIPWCSSSGAGPLYPLVGLTAAAASVVELAFLTAAGIWILAPLRLRVGLSTMLLLQLCVCFL
jgi:hypothetical protein